ncbi:putative MFS-type transporter C09D4.1-like protein [Dinothrombium tinctorium]|uniref:Putative MFS-type transporter C09D4.1-like protein n=1 Tax=Dinothrombium tinctorium TaxID=1965070 RepID=A0A3S3NSZ4_9ACAR|nr:putative MFS-type transporter C09D4.1-like protein [Dinothrombium tinctorium]RWS01189.1 putative MFS-type transporter C09D4.1-like protein [Dinothrombium tinctorium]RWS03663.1 putative MFS-type transporter C09D4.1-like protein [Dinothrombium tinctorium]
MTSSIFIGSAVSYIYPLIFKNAQEEDEIKSTLFNTKIMLTALSILGIFLVIFFVRSNPPQPANFAEARRSRKNKSSLGSLLLLFRNANLILIIVNIFVTAAVTTVLWVLLNQIFSKDFEESATITTIAGLSYNVSAIVGCLVFPIVLDKTKRYRLLIFSTYSIAFIFSLIFMAALWFKLPYLIYTSLFVFGACSFGQRVMMYDLIVEITYPFPEGTSIGIITSLAYMFAACFIPLLSWLIELFSILYAILLIETMLLIGFLPLFFISIKLLRNEAEQSNNSPTDEQCEKIEIKN